MNGCSSVTLPFWDERSVFSQQNGIPRALAEETFELDRERNDKDPSAWRRRDNSRAPRAPSSQARPQRSEQV
jgi:hypothetical protein